MALIAISDTKVGAVSGHSKPSAEGAELDETIPSDIKDRPNTALWVTKDHQIYQKDVPYPECPPDSCVVHVVSCLVDPILCVLGD